MWGQPLVLLNSTTILVLLDQVDGWSEERPMSRPLPRISMSPEYQRKGTLPITIRGPSFLWSFPSLSTQVVSLTSLSARPRWGMMHYEHYYINVTIISFDNTTSTRSQIPLVRFLEIRSKPFCKKNLAYCWTCYFKTTTLLEGKRIRKHHKRGKQCFKCLLNRIT